MKRSACAKAQSREPDEVQRLASSAVAPSAPVPTDPQSTTAEFTGVDQRRVEQPQRRGAQPGTATHTYFFMLSFNILQPASKEKKNLRGVRDLGRHTYAWRVEMKAGLHEGNSRWQAVQGI